MTDDMNNDKKPEITPADPNVETLGYVADGVGKGHAGDLCCTGDNTQFATNLRRQRMEKCSKCDYPGNGKCKECHGSRKMGGWDALAASLSGTNQNCPKCSGTGKCPHCRGKGYISKGIFG